MNIKLHKQATTTPKIRAEIQQAPADISDLALARKYGVFDSSTIRRWRYRTDIYRLRGDHPFDLVCLKHSIEHRLIKPS